MQTNYSIIIPAYNEEEVLDSVLDNLGLPAGCKEVILVDDGSIDRTAEIALSKGAKVIKHDVNKGYGASIKTGILAATEEFVVLFDGDGQHKKEDLLNVVSQIEQFDMVVGARRKDSHLPLIRRPGKLILKWFVNFISAKKIPDFNSGLRTFRTAVIRKYLHMMPDGFSFSTTSTVALYKMKFRVSHVPITTGSRGGRKSSVKILRDGIRAIMLIINLTVLFNPLRVFLPISFFFFAGSLIYFITYSLVRRVHVTPSMVMLFVTSVLLFFLGVICDQISAIRRELSTK